MARIYIVEDDKSIQEIEEIALKNSGHQLSCYDNAAEFQRALAAELPDLVILDVMLPDQDGYSILKDLRCDDRTRSLPVIMVTAKSAEMDMIRGLDMGADDYIRKPFSVIELITRVKVLLRRTLEAEHDPDRTSRLTLGTIVMDDERHQAYVADEPLDLTYKEYELLKYLMVNRGIVMSREKIMLHVWETDFEGESRTVDMHIRTLRKKLGDSSSHIKTVRNVGYVME